MSHLGGVIRPPLRNLSQVLATNLVERPVRLVDKVGLGIKGINLCLREKLGGTVELPSEWFGRQRGSDAPPARRGTCR